MKYTETDNVRVELTPKEVCTAIAEYVNAKCKRNDIRHDAVTVDWKIYDRLAYTVELNGAFVTVILRKHEEDR